MTNKITLNRGLSGEKEMAELSECEAKKYKVLGRAVGFSMELCLFEAHKHCKNFMERVKGYRKIEDDGICSKITKTTNKEYISVEFYE